MFKLRFIGQHAEYEKPWGATVLGMLDEYESKSKIAGRLAQFIRMLREKRRNLAGTMKEVIGDKLEKVLEAAKRLDDFARQYCGAKGLDLNILKNAEILAEEFDAELMELRLMEGLEEGFLDDIDGYYFDWRGLKYNARSRYFQRTWENYLRLHNKEFSEGREAEYMAKCIAAAMLMTAQPPIPYSKELVGKEAAKILRNPIFKVMLKSNPGKLRDLISKNHFDTIGEAIGAPFKDEKKNMAKALAGLDVIRNIGMKGSLSAQTAKEWHDLYNKIGEITETFKLGGMTERAMSSGLSEIYQATHRALKADRNTKSLGPSDMKMTENAYDILATLGSINKNAKVMAVEEASKNNVEDISKFGVEANFRRLEKQIYAEVPKVIEVKKTLLKEDDVPASAVINRDVEKENVRIEQENDKKNKLNAYNCWLVIQQEMQMQGAMSFAEFAASAIGLAALAAIPLYRQSKDIKELEKGYEYFIKANEYETAKSLMPKVTEKTYDKYKAPEPRKELIESEDPAGRISDEIHNAQAVYAREAEAAAAAEMMNHYNNAREIFAQYNQPMPFEPVEDFMEMLAKPVEQPKPEEPVKNNPVEEPRILLPNNDDWK